MPKDNRRMVDSHASKIDRLKSEVLAFLGNQKRAREAKRRGYAQEAAFQRRIVAWQARIDAHKHTLRKGKLTKAEIEKIDRFGDIAIAQTPQQAQDLSEIRGRIVQEREKRALAQFRPSKLVLEWLDQNLGFKIGAHTMSAAHKGLRANAAFLMSKKMRKFFRENFHLNFYFVTLIHDGWRTLDRETFIDLRDIRKRVHNTLAGHDLEYLGVIEFDALTNYPNKGAGLCIMPHVHLIVWTMDELSPADLTANLADTRRLVSEWGADIVVSSQLSERNIVHKSQYMFEQAFKAKRLGGKHPETGKRALIPVYKAVPPHLTLRLSEILAHCTLKDLIVSSGSGVLFKGALLKALRRQQRKAGFSKNSIMMSAAQAFAKLRESTTRGMPRGAVAVRK